MNLLHVILRVLGRNGHEAQIARQTVAHERVLLRTDRALAEMQRLERVAARRAR